MKEIDELIELYSADKMIPSDKDLNIEGLSYESIYFKLKMLRKAFQMDTYPAERFEMNSKRLIELLRKELGK